ncbi:MAG: flagellar motor switch protein FliN, partial [Rhizobium oryzihabitans]
MATKKTPVTDDAALPSLEDGGDIDQAIGDLRGVLKTDAEGSLSDFGDFGDFGSVDDASAENDLSAFGGGAADFAMDDFAAAPQVAGVRAPLGSG